MQRDWMVVLGVFALFGAGLVAGLLVNTGSPDVARMFQFDGASAAWVQAIGSILAIVFAVIIAGWQRHREHRLFVFTSFQRRLEALYHCKKSVVNALGALNDMAETAPAASGLCGDKYYVSLLDRVISRLDKDLAEQIERDVWAACSILNDNIFEVRGILSGDANSKYSLENHLIGSIELAEKALAEIESVQKELYGRGIKYL